MARGGVLEACASSAFTARVAGRRIAKVVFSLDGERIRTDRSAPCTARVDDPRSGTPRVRARVTFVSDSPTKARTRTFRHRRCAAPARSMRFTG